MALPPACAIREAIKPLFPIALALLAASPALADPFREQIRPLVEKYCLDCHDGPKPKGDVDLALFETPESLWRNPKLWEKVLVQLQDKVMPPAKKTAPTEAERGQLTAWLRETLAHPDPAQIPRDPGPSLPHRLTRLEYNNTVRDLLGVELHPADAFPPDGGGGAGFDNNASTLFVPPVLLERYLAAADLLLQATKLLPEEPPPADGQLPPALKSLAARAFRRPVAPGDWERLAQLYWGALSRGESPADATRLTAKAILCSPQFLFRVEPVAADASEPQLLDDYALASRLSYFLWSSMPDRELFRQAAAGTLHEPATLEAQVHRLLAEPKATILAENFAGQWLRVKEVRESVSPAPDRFKQFTPELREAFYREPVAFFHALLHDDLPLLDCLDCDYTYANEPLAKFYGLPSVSGPEMRRVPMPDRNRGGLLGMAGIHALTSFPRRTSPVLRGKWVMEEILGTPPPPPPPEVNTAAVEQKKAGEGTFRHRLEQHRAEPKCAGCHARMDPLGFGLENFGVIGEWRTENDREPIDASGQLVDGQQFNGPLELKKLLLQQQDVFVRNVTEKLLAYALGRGLEPADWYPVQQIAQAVAANGYRTQSLILGIVKSYPFQYHRTPASTATAQITP